MPDPRREGALAGYLLPGRHGAPVDPPGALLAARVPGAMAQICGAHEAATLNALVQACALVREPCPLQCTAGEAASLLWNGPGQYLAVSWRHHEHELAAALNDALRGGAASAVSAGSAAQVATAYPATAVAVDVSHARTVLHLAGPARIEILAQGCSLDLDAMQAGQCAATMVSHFNVLVHCLGQEGFELYVTRSLAHSFFEWLCRAGAPYGVEIRA